jgi:hypothetical protein
VLVDGLKALDPNRPIREADISGPGQHFSFVQILLQKSAIAMVRLRRRFSGTVFLSRRV